MSPPARLDRAFITVSGPDAVPFLDNLLTQNVSDLTEARTGYAALLSPQGKVVCDMRLWAQAGRLHLEVAPSRAEELLRRLSMYKLRANVELSPNAPLMVLWSTGPFEDATPDPRLPALGSVMLATADTAEAGDAAYDAHRIALGVPDLARDAAPEEVFAGEALLDELNGVDFHKGCFVGQENTSRMKRRATTRKKLCPVVFEGPAPAYGAVIKAGEAEIGQIRTGMDGRAMALLRLDRALGAAQLAAEGRDLRLDPPPWLILPQREGAQD